MLERLTIISVLIAVSPSIAQAEATLFGKLQASYGFSEVSDKKTYAVSDAGSRLGLKDAIYIDQLTEASYIVEAATGLTDEREVFDEVRQAWVGWRSDLGEVRIGRHLSPLRVSASPVDLFEDQQTDQSNILEADIEHYKSIAYINRLGNMGYAVTLSSERTNNHTAVDVLTNYTAGPIYIAAAYLKGYGEHRAARLAARYRFATGHQLGIAYEKNQAATAQNNDYSAYVINAGLRFGRTFLKTQYGRNKPASGAKTESLLGIGLDYDLTDKTRLQFQYSVNRYPKHTRNDSQREEIFTLGVLHEF